MQTLETRDKLQWLKGREKEDLARLAREKEEREWWQEEQRASIEGAAILQAAEVCLPACLPASPPVACFLLLLLLLSR